MTEKRHNPIPEFKIKIVSELAELINSHKTVLVASIDGLPAAKFQEIGKKMRGKAVIKVPRRNLFNRAVDESKVKDKEALKAQYQKNIAFLFSNDDAFDLAADLLKNKSPAKAKPGQIAPADIEVQAGMTELVPGPAISELGAVGLKTKVTNGKLEIVADKVIVAEGKEINQNAADVMSKLNILPFSIGYLPVTAFEVESEKAYLEINIDTEATVESLVDSFVRALPFALEIGYVTGETAKLMIQKAGQEEAKLIRAINGEPEPEAAPSEETKEEDTNPKEAKEEPKVDAAAGLGALFG
ncbi:50S ribosomal protein L10 [Candidatus Pacearchaeota archaeon]|nr:50S ribosomal protein L10 [Candidatus Pacearchaeota archaeon]